jgi:hypothetical protein
MTYSLCVMCCHAYACIHDLAYMHNIPCVVAYQNNVILFTFLWIYVNALQPLATIAFIIVQTTYRYANIQVYLSRLHSSDRPCSCDVVVCVGRLPPVDAMIVFDITLPGDTPKIYREQVPAT